MPVSDGLDKIWAAKLVGEFSMQSGTPQGCFNAGWQLLLLSSALLVVQSVSAQSFGSTAPASTEAWRHGGAFVRPNLFRCKWLRCLQLRLASRVL